MAEGQGLWKAGTQARCCHQVPRSTPSPLSLPLLSSGPRHLFRNLTPSLIHSCQPLPLSYYFQISMRTSPNLSLFKNKQANQLPFRIPHDYPLISPNFSISFPLLNSLQPGFHPPGPADRARVQSSITRKDLLCMLVPALLPLVCKCEIGERAGFLVGPLGASSIIRNSIMRKNICTTFHVTKGLNLSPAQSPLVVSQSH